LNHYNSQNYDRYNSYLFTDTEHSALNILETKAQYSEDAKQLDGREILQACFDAAFARDPRVLAFGEDVGRIGDVNQGFAGLQEKYGEVRISDTGIREATIIGQGIGLAMRGLRPIAEIQYLDYLLYGLQTLSDDLASLSYRTKAGQKAPLIIRTRGHRLEGIWHSGSPIGMILHALRGIHVLVPRNMTQAAGFYNTLLKADEPALVIECLNGYRLKEALPDNIGEFTLPLGHPEILVEGNDVTLVTYGSCCRVAQDAILELNEMGISVELIDVQSLLPFDIHHHIVDSLKKTNKVLFFDEDVPGGASSYMMQQVLEEQKGYYHLDAAPRTLTAKAHRPAYGTDGDYFSKPSADDVVECIYEMMHEADPSRFPL
jgi:pyruvate/2-oxoglutarate/acetoin dehydrogenase E1 component